MGRQSPLSVCLFSVFAALLPAMCERIHTVSPSSTPGESRKTSCAFLPEAVLKSGWILMIGVKYNDDIMSLFAKFVNFVFSVKFHSSS